MLSFFDIFNIGFGPSSSHTVVPMRAARRFAEHLAASCELARTASVKVELFGSLGHTGRGHGSDTAVILGLEGEDPETVDVDAIAGRVAAVAASAKVTLAGKAVDLLPAQAIIFHKKERMPLHPNGMRFTAFAPDGAPVVERMYYSVGGGFVIGADGVPLTDGDAPPTPPYPFSTGAGLLEICANTGLSMSTVMLENERAVRSEADVKASVLRVWQAMEGSIKRGCEREGILPGGLKVRRRAAGLHRKLRSAERGNADPLIIMDWVNLFALAVNEENAAGGLVVTAPTNGAAGVIPAVIQYYRRFTPNADDEGTIRFLLTAAAIAILYKENASISCVMQNARRRAAGDDGRIGVCIRPTPPERVS